MTLASLFVELALKADSFNNGIRAAQKEAKELEKTIKPTTELLKDIGASATKAGMVMSVAFTAPIVAVAGLGVAFNAMQEQAQVAFTTMLGDGGKAKVFLEGLKDFAAKTPFEFPDLVRAAQRLMAMGFAATDVKPLLSAVGNAVAGLGGGAAEIDRVTLALGQMSGRGKIATGEMNQLTEVGIPAWKILADGIGVTEGKLRGMVEKGMVPAGKGIEVLVAGMNDKFGGMMEKQAETFNGLVSTIKDESRFLAAELTTGLFDVIKGPALVVVNALHGLREATGGWSSETKTVVVVIAALVAAAGPLLLILGTMATQVSNLMTLYAKLTPLIWTSTGATTAFGASLKSLAVSGGPILLTVAAVAALGVALYKLREAFIASNQAQDDAIRHTSEAASSTERAAKALKDKYNIEIPRGTKSTQEWAEALGQAAQAAGRMETQTRVVAKAVSSGAEQQSRFAAMLRAEKERDAKDEDKQFDAYKKRIADGAEAARKAATERSEAVTRFNE